MMCDQCQCRPAEPGSVFCRKCGRWEVWADLTGVAALVLGTVALLLLAEVLR